MLTSPSSQNVAHQIEEGTFRSDLFHRLSIVPLQLSPLKERREDVPALVELFIDQIARMHNLKSLAIGEDAIAVLQAQDWPGNARQLRNSIERLLSDLTDVPTDGEVKPELMESVCEIATTPVRNTTEAGAQLRSLRRTVNQVAQQSGLAIGSAGTHPFALWEDQRVVARPRYRDLISGLQFVARLINEPGRKKGSPAAYRAGWPGRLREMDPIAALDQHAQGRIEVLALIDAIEGIGEQHDFAPVFLPERLGGGLERVATECR